MYTDGARYQTRACYVHRKVADNDVLISVGENVANFNGFISLNPTASFLWDALSEPRTADELVRALREEFDVSEQTARADVEEFLRLLTGNSMVTVQDDEAT